MARDDQLSTLYAATDRGGDFASVRSYVHTELMKKPVEIESFATDRAIPARAGRTRRCAAKARILERFPQNLKTLR